MLLAKFSAGGPMSLASDNSERRSVSLMWRPKIETAWRILGAPTGRQHPKLKAGSCERATEGMNFDDERHDRQASKRHTSRSANATSRRSSTAFEADQARLAKQGVPDGVIAPGSVLPDVTLVDPHGSPTSLCATLGSAPAVVVFYRRPWCPYCNIALKTDEAELLPRLQERGVALIAVSPERPGGSLSTKDELTFDELSFTVFSDPGNTLSPRGRHRHDAFGGFARGAAGTGP